MVWIMIPTFVCIDDSSFASFKHLFFFKNAIKAFHDIIIKGARVKHDSILDRVGTNPSFSTIS